MPSLAPDRCAACRNAIGPDTPRCWGRVGGTQGLWCGDCLLEDSVWLDLSRLGTTGDPDDEKYQRGPYQLREQEEEFDGAPGVTFIIEGPGAPDVYGHAHLVLDHPQSDRIRNALRTEYQRAAFAANYVFWLALGERSDKRSCRCSHSLRQHHQGKCKASGCGCLYFRDPKEV